MKKFLYLSIFFFSFILLGLSCVNASVLKVNDLGVVSCLDDNDVLTYSCQFLDGQGTISNASQANQTRRVSNYFLVSSEFSLTNLDSYRGSTSRLCYYDKDFIFISCSSVFSLLSGETQTFSSPNDSYFARLQYNGVVLVSIDDDLNSISSLNYAINSLTQTVGSVFNQFTWVFLLAFSIVVIGFIIALILRVGK